MSIMNRAIFFFGTLKKFWVKVLKFSSYQYHSTTIYIHLDWYILVCHLVYWYIRVHEQTDEKPVWYFGVSPCMGMYVE